LTWRVASDIFLGSERTTGPDGIERDFYLRQLRDWLAAPIEQMLPAGVPGVCRPARLDLAHAHARSGDRIALAAYLDKSD
jgi:hypothetical protein